MTVMFSRKKSFPARRGSMDGWLPQLEDLAFSCFFPLLVGERLLDKSGWKNLLAEFTGMAFNANHHVDGESFRDDFF